jgi:hypothetical protein
MLRTLSVMAASGRRRKPAIKCRGPRESDGRACQRGVGRPGQRCKHHVGLPEVPPGGRLPQYIKRTPKKVRSKATKKAAPRRAAAGRPTIPRQRTVAMAQPRIVMSERARETLVAEAIDYFEATIDAGILTAAANRAADYAGDRIWAGLTHDWLGRNCKGLARLAVLTLTGKDWIHDRIGALAGSLLELLGTPRVARAFGREIAKRIPMPWDHQLIVVARSMQIAGILICALNDRDLAQCECFVDVVISEGKERVEELMRKAAGNWEQLAQLVVPAG